MAEQKQAKMTESVPDRLENNVRKGENAGHQHFLLFRHCFQKASFSSMVKTQDCLVKV